MKVEWVNGTEEQLAISPPRCSNYHLVHETPGELSPIRVHPSGHTAKWEAAVGVIKRMEEEIAPLCTYVRLLFRMGFHVRKEKEQTEKGRSLLVGSFT